METDVKGTVLIVEDADGFRDIYRAVVEADGYRVIEASDGKMAVDLVLNQKPDLVLLDLILPEFDGFQVLRKIRENDGTKSTPVIIVSVLGGREHLQKAFDLGANDYSVKGAVSPRDVLARIHSLLGEPGVKECVGVGSAYHLSVNEGRDDAPRLQRQLGLGRSFQCPHCRERVVLELSPDTATSVEGHRFSARFVCSVCGRGV